MVCNSLLSSSSQSLQRKAYTRVSTHPLRLACLLGRRRSEFVVLRLGQHEATEDPELLGVLHAVRRGRHELLDDPRVVGPVLRKSHEEDLEIAETTEKLTVVRVALERTTM